MTDPLTKASRSAGSGEHVAVREFRAKQDSIAENTVPELEALNARLDVLVAKEKERSEPPAKSQDDIDTVPELPVAEDVPVIESEPDPFPSLPPKKD